MRRSSAILLAILVLFPTAHAQTVAELVGHAGPVTGLLPFPDGVRLASVSFDKSIKLWDLNTKAQIKSVTPGDALLALALHPTLPQLAVGSRDQRAFLWNYSAGDPSKQLGPLAADSVTLARTPDANRLASLGADGIARLIDLTTGQLVGEWKAHEGAVHSLDFAADGNIFVTTGADGTLATWKSPGELVERRALGHPATRARLASSAGILLSADAAGELRAMRWPTPAVTPYPGHATDVVDFKRTATTLISLGTDQSFHVHDLMTGSERKTFPHPVKVSAWTLAPTDENLLITAGEDRLLRAWNIAEGTLVATSTETPDVVRALAFLPDGKTLALGEAGGTLRTIPYPFVVEYNERALDAHAGPLVSLARSSKTGFLLTASGDQTIKLWDAAGVGVRPFALFAPVRQAILAETEDRIAAVGTDNVLRCWQINGAELKVLPNVTGAIAFSLDGKLLVYAGAENKIHVVPTDFSAEPRALAGHAAPVKSLVVSPAGNVTISGAADGTIKVIDIASGAEVKNLAGHQGAVSALAVSADAKTLLSAGEDKVIRLWNLETGAITASFAEATAPILSLALMPDASAFAAATSDNVVRVYRQGSLRSTIAAPAPAGIAFGLDFKTLILAQQDAKLKILVEREPRLLGKHGASVKQLAATPDGKQLLSLGDDNLARLWDLASGKSPRAFAHASVVTHMSLSADAGTLLTAETSGKVRSWQLVTGEPAMLVALPAPIVGLALRPDASEWSALAGDQLHRGKLDGTIVEATPAPGLSNVAYSANPSELLLGGKEKRLERSSPALAWKVSATPNLVALETTPEGKVITLASDGAASIRSASTGDLLANVATMACTTGTIDREGKKLLVVGTDLKPRLYDLTTSSLVAELAALPAAATSTEILPDGHTLLFGLANGQAITYVDGQLRATFATPAAVTSARGLTDSRQFVSLSADRILRWFEEPLPITIELTGQEGSLFDIAYSPDGKKIATASSNGSILVRDLANPSAHQTLKGHQGHVYSVAFAADGATLASAGADKTVILWNLADGKELKRFAGAEGPLYRVHFVGADRLAATGVDRRVRVWEIATGNLVATLESSEEIYGLAVKADSTKLATAGLGGTITVWDLATSQAVFTHKLPAPTYALCYRPSAPQLVIAAADGKIYLLDLPEAAR